MEYYTFIAAPKTQQPIRRGLTNQARPANSQSQKAFQINQAGQQPITEGLSNQVGNQQPIKAQQISPSPARVKERVIQVLCRIITVF